MGKQDIEIARAVTLKPIQEVAEALGLSAADLEPFSIYRPGAVSFCRAKREAPKPSGETQPTQIRDVIRGTGSVVLG